MTTAARAQSEAAPSEAALAGDLRQAVNRLAFHLRTAATRQGITPTRLSALVALAKGGPQRSGDLATSLGITAASMSRLTEALEAGGWMLRCDDPQDHRACVLTLTTHGRATLAALRSEGTTRLSTQIAALVPEQRAALAAAIPVLVTLADGHLQGAAPGARHDGPVPS